jgi:hypothetical protein
MEQDKVLPLTRSEKIVVAERSTGQKNYVRARIQAEKAQANSAFSGESEPITAEADIPGSIATESF